VALIDALSMVGALRTFYVQESVGIKENSGDRRLTQSKIDRSRKKLLDMLISPGGPTSPLDKISWFA